MFQKRKKSDDLQPFIKLLKEHQANLRAFIVSIIPGSPDVADILQEANLVLWQKRNKFELGTNFIAWSFQIARYEVHRQRNRSRRHERIMFSEQLVDLLSDANSTYIEEENLHAALDKCMEQLNADEREIIQERYTPGHSLEGYSATSGRTAGSLRIALLRIREKLRHCVENTLSTES